jgi:branched-chain amino acid aminotransferase
MPTESESGLIVYFNGSYVPLAEARIGILTHALHYGTGVFEGIRAYWNADHQELYLLRALEHFARWRQNCSILRIAVPHTPEELTAITLGVLRRNAFKTDVYIRPLAFKCAERIGVHLDDHDALAIIAIPMGEYLDTKGVHAGVSSWRRIEDNAIPARAKICGAYVNSARASADARAAGFDEAILLNESGHVAEGATCNLFMVRHGKLITPPVTENVLEGITRESVMRLAAWELDVETIERAIDRSELYICDEMFFTGTAVGIAPVVRVDHRAVNGGEIGTITRRMQHVYAEVVHGRLQPYRNWLTPVYQAQVEDEEDVFLPAVGAAV